MRVIINSLHVKTCGTQKFIPKMKRQRPPLTAIGKATPLVNAFFEKREGSIPMIDWSPPEVLEWLCEEAHKQNREYEKMCLTNFSDVDGRTLLNMTKCDFMEKDRRYGNFLFQIVERHKSSDKTLKKVVTLENRKPPHDIVHIDKKSLGPRIARLPIKRNRRKKCGRVWEFIRDLLKKPEYCPSMICWENYEQGIFRFVQSNKVAELWGKIKNNPEMNFEKFSRAMRQNYRNNILRPVRGRLVYGFGERATGWQTDDPNFRRSPTESTLCG